MDAGYIQRNVADCEQKIESLELRIKNVNDSGDDVDWLKSELDGFKATLKKLTQSDSD